MRCRASNSRFDHGVLAVVGRNGMGKTTLCKAIMGLVRASSGSIRFAGEELTRPHAGRDRAARHRLRAAGAPAVALAHRRRAPARWCSGSQRGAWTIERIYDTFPRLAERKNNRGGELSGGEQQMLAISRALLLNPRLLVMDEPTEGLAPVIVAQVEEMLVRLAEEGEIAVLVIEQNIGVATAVAENVAIMVNGRINRVIESHAARRRPRPAAAPAGRRPARRGRHAPRRTCRTMAAPAHAGAAGGARPATHLRLEPGAADALVAAGAGRADRGAGAHQLRQRHPSCAAGAKRRRRRLAP